MTEKKGGKRKRKGKLRKEDRWEGKGQGRKGEEKRGEERKKSTSKHGFKFYYFMSILLW